MQTITFKFNNMRTIITKLMTALLLLVSIEGFGQTATLYATSPYDGCLADYPMSFYVSVTGLAGDPGTYTYTWGGNSTVSGIVIVGNPGSTIDTVLPSNGFVYCTVTDTAGNSVITQSLPANAENPPALTVDPMTDTVVLGSTLTYRFGINSGGYSAVTAYMQNMLTGNPVSNVTVNVTNDTVTMVIPNIGYSDSGIYQISLVNSSCSAPGYAGELFLTVVNVASHGSAGPDQTICLNSTATMAAIGTGTWTQPLTNPGNTIISSATSPTTTITGFATGGIYYYIWTSAGSADTMIVDYRSTPIAPFLVAWGGYCLGDTIVAAVPSGDTLYSMLNGSPYSTIISSGVVYLYPGQPGIYTAYISSICGVHSLLSDTVSVTNCSVSPCGFKAFQRSGCQDFQLSLTDTTSGAGNTTSWVIHTPTDTLYGFNIQFFAFIDYPGTVTVTMSDTIGGQVCTVVDSNFTVYPNPVIQGSFSNVVACQGSCVTWNDASTAGAGCSGLLFLLDWGAGGPLDTLPAQCQNYTVPGIYSPSIRITNSCGCFADTTFINAITINNCGIPDTVWPGDADNNKFVDNNDLLPIGLAYDSTGPVRMVQGIVWQGDTATSWADTLPGYAPLVNFNHADCNGDGTINADDTVAIVTNFGDVHAKTNALPGLWRSGIPGIQLSFSQDTVLNQDTLTTNISLGTSMLPASGIYGLAFTFNYDPLLVDTNYSIFTFNSSWLGNGTNSININRNFATGQVKAAITGIDHISRAGFGQIGTFSCIITTDNINGKDYSYYANKQYISDVTAIDQYGNPLQLNAGIDSNYVAFIPNGVRNINSQVAIRIYPNPASTQVVISADVAITSITISDILGENVSSITVNGKKSETADISALTAGIYVVHVSTSYGTRAVKLTVTR
jgi:hypothetical protein